MKKKYWKKITKSTVKHILSLVVDFGPGTEKLSQ